MSEREERLEAALREIDEAATKLHEVCGGCRVVQELARAALAGEEKPPALCGAENGPARCSRWLGHPGFHSGNGKVWGTSSKGYPMDPERTLTIPPEGPTP